MNIINLKDALQHLHTLAKWHHNEWAYLNPEETLPERIDRMASDFEEALIPSTFIAIEGDKLIGSAALAEADMGSYKPLSPWLASVFVRPSYRKQGIGSSLVKHVMATAQKNGITELYLFTPNQESFYTRLGWTRLSKEQYCGSWVSIMSITLKSPKA